MRLANGIAKLGLGWWVELQFFDCRKMFVWYPDVAWILFLRPALINSDQRSNARRSHPSVQEIQDV